ncbi:MAG: Sec-independent protein translocase subunit TatC, partial [Halomonas sp.]|nr:Sec-independent protein translocase subunit TatC [Halomonas sp.]
MSDSDDKQELGQAPLIEHLVELRSRLLRAVVAVLVIFLG